MDSLKSDNKTEQNKQADRQNNRKDILTYISRTTTISPEFATGLDKKNQLKIDRLTLTR